MFSHKEWLVKREHNWQPESDSGRPSGGLTLNVLELCGFEIRKVSRTAVIGDVKKKFSERLLLVPAAVAETMDLSSLTPARVREFTDKKSGEIFTAILLSQTRPRPTSKAPRPVVASRLMLVKPLPKLGEREKPQEWTN